MIGILIGIVVLAASAVVAVWRMAAGPGDVNRVLASDLLFFAVIGLIALLGILTGMAEVFDLILVATLLGFLATVSLARALTNGRR